MLRLSVCQDILELPEPISGEENQDGQTEDGGPDKQQLLEQLSNTVNQVSFPQFLPQQQLMYNAG